MTIGWNVDPRDWALPGIRAIVTRVLTQTRPGSIVLMHDGGGQRSETVAALPRIIAALLARGLRFVTVPELFGLRGQTSMSSRPATDSHEARRPTPR
jgi:peptidoglycan/xylan/chitin deacetylase (PgdA/CDA1 family)